LFSFNAMHFPGMRKALTGRQFVSALALVFVFFLPLHFHLLTPTAQLSQECSCYHGVRTQAGLMPATAQVALTFTSVLVIFYVSQVNDRLSLNSYAIRGPPLSIAL
jgi:hypothetical protein